MRSSKSVRAINCCYNIGPDPPTCQQVETTPRLRKPAGSLRGAGKLCGACSCVTGRRRVRSPRPMETPLPAACQAALPVCSVQPQSPAMSHRAVLRALFTLPLLCWCEAEVTSARTVEGVKIVQETRNKRLAISISQISSKKAGEQQDAPHRSSALLLLTYYYNYWHDKSTKRPPKDSLCWAQNAAKRRSLQSSQFKQSR